MRAKRRWMPWWLALLACLPWGLGGWMSAQAVEIDTPKPRQFSVLDGLPSNTINDIDEDRQGYLWIATRDGLARYDGVGFRIWRVGSGLQDNQVGVVHVDPQDRIWIGTDNAGMAMLDPRRDLFQQFDHRSHPEIRSSRIWSIESTPDGALWFGTAQQGLYRRAPNGEIRRFTHDPRDPASLPANGIGALLPDGRNGLWIGTLAGLAHWDGRRIERVALPGDQQWVQGLVRDDDGAIWIRLAGKALVRRLDGRIEPMPFSDPVLDEPALNLMLQDRQGTRWLDTRSGLARERRGEVQDVPLYSQTSRGLVRPQWMVMHEDREGGLWFGSSDTGLWYLPANWRDFSLLTRRIDDDSTPANAFVRGVAPSRDGALWLVGSGGVLDRLDPNTGAVRHMLGAICNTQFLDSVIETTNGIVWIGCKGQLVRVDPSTLEVARWTSGDRDDPAPAGNVSAFAAAEDGAIWVSDGGVLQLRDRNGGVQEQLRAGDGRGLEREINQLAAAPDGGLWLAGTTGLSMWNAGARRVEAVPGAPRAELAGFSIAPNGIVWLAGNGTLESFRWDGARLHPATRVGAAEGWPTVRPSGIAVDASGDVWVPTVRGLLRYDPRRRRLRLYGVRDGLPSQEFGDSPIRISPQGYLALGTADGLLLFHPRQIEWSAHVPNLAISAVDVRRGDQRVELKRSGRIDMQPGDRDLRVVARLLSFTNTHAHRYRFRLQGYDPGWVETGSDGERLFASLAPGNYTLQVIARTADGEWSQPQSIEVRMAPPWWRTAWAYSLFVLATLSLLVWAARAYRARLKRRHNWQLAKQQKALAEQASEAKTRFLAMLGHEVRTPMTGVLGMSELLLGGDLAPQQRSQVESIRRAGEHLLRLVNDALDLARIEAGKLQLETGEFDLRALLHDVVGLMAPLAERNGLRFETTVAEDLPAALRGDRTRVAQILLNLLGNAIKFTERGFVALEAGPLAGGGVRFAVADSGPGLNDEQRQRLFRRFEQAEGARTSARYGGSGLGLAISQELAAAMNGRIDVESTPGKGTRFIVELPLEAADPVTGVGLSSATGETLAASRIGSTAAPALRLLLVEDDPTVAEVISSLLRAQGHTVTHVPHGLAAMAETSAQPFDIGLLDLDLPGIDGIALARQLRAQGFTQPLIAVTARADAEAEPAARDAGFDGFLRKPLTGRMLADALSATATP